MRINIVLTAENRYAYRREPQRNHIIIDSAVPCDFSTYSAFKLFSIQNIN